MQRYKVEDMSCGHCASAIERAIRGIDPTASVKVDLGAREVSVETDAEVSVIAEALKLAGYDNQVL